MIKRYNENWGPIIGGSRKGHFPIIINAVEGDTINYSIERAMKLAKKENATILLIIDGLELEVSPERTTDDILRDYHTGIKYQDNSKDYWKDYWEQKSKDPDFEMDTIDDYAMRHSISRTDAERFFKANHQAKPKTANYNSFEEYLEKSKPKFQINDIVYDYSYRMYGKVVDYQPSKEESYLIDFDDGTSVWLEGDGLVKSNKNINSNENLTPVIGLPSGEIIYMNSKQITYFRARNQVMYKKIYRKTVGEQIESVDLESYTFKDSEYDDIKFKIELFTWS